MTFMCVIKLSNLLFVFKEQNISESFWETIEIQNNEGFFPLIFGLIKKIWYTSNGFVGPLIAPWVTDLLQVLKALKEPRVGAFRSATSLRYFGKYALNKLLGGLLSFWTVTKTWAAFSGLSFPRQMCNHSTSLLLEPQIVDWNTERPAEWVIDGVVRWDWMSSFRVSEFPLALCWKLGLFFGLQTHLEVLLVLPFH